MTAENNIKTGITEMARLALSMWQETFRAFMEHDLGILSRVLEDEHRINDSEKEITSLLASLGPTLKSEQERSNALIFAEIAEDLELIGDYCKDTLERVQIKIEEKLLFSEDAVKEYTELYRVTESGLKDVVAALEKNDFRLVEGVVKEKGHIDPIVDEFRARHNRRLLEGSCSPMACNMFLNMLDFAAAVYYHTKKISRNLLKIKQ
jgi:phosphate:Na+ symporter